MIEVMPKRAISLMGKARNEPAGLHARTTDTPECGPLRRHGRERVHEMGRQLIAGLFARDQEDIQGFAISHARCRSHPPPTRNNP